MPTVEELLETHKYIAREGIHRATKAKIFTDESVINDPLKHVVLTVFFHMLSEHMSKRKDPKELLEEYHEKARGLPAWATSRMRSLPSLIEKTIVIPALQKAEKDFGKYVPGYKLGEEHLPTVYKHALTLMQKKQDVRNKVKSLAERLEKQLDRTPAPRRYWY